MHSQGIVIASLLLAAAACSSGNPLAAGNSTGRSSGITSSDASTSDDTEEEDAAVTTADASDAGLDALDAADGFDGYYPPPPSECNPEMTIGSATSVGTSGARFAGITRDELTIAWTVTNGAKTSLFVADRDTVEAAFGDAQKLSHDAASDGVALTDDGLRIVAAAADHRSFIVYARDERDTDFGIGDDSPFDPVIEALDPAEKIGDPVFINSDVVMLYSVYGKSADTMRMANRISIYADFYPAYTLAFDAFRAQGDARRRPTGTGDDFQVIFFWDEVSQTEKLARLNGTEYVLNVKDLGAHPWAQANRSCSRVYFGEGDVFAATAY